MVRRSLLQVLALALCWPVLSAQARAAEPAPAATAKVRFDKASRATLYVAAGVREAFSNLAPQTPNLRLLHTARGAWKGLRLGEDVWAVRTIRAKAGTRHIAFRFQGAGEERLLSEVLFVDGAGAIVKQLDTSTPERLQKLQRYLNRINRRTQPMSIEVRHNVAVPAPITTPLPAELQELFR